MHYCLGTYDHIAQTPICVTYRRTPTLEDLVATTNHCHIYFILFAQTHRHGQDVVLVKQHCYISCKPIAVLENHQHVNHALPSYHARGDYLTHGEKFLTKMQLNMAQLATMRRIT